MILLQNIGIGILNKSLNSRMVKYSDLNFPNCLVPLNYWKSYSDTQLFCLKCPVSKFLCVVKGNYRQTYEMLEDSTYVQGTYHSMQRTIAVQFLEMFSAYGAVAFFTLEDIKYSLYFHS